MEMGIAVDKMSLDNGYNSGSNLQSLEESGIDAYVATDCQEKAAGADLETSDRKFVKADFTDDADADVLSFRPEKSS